MAAQYLYNIVLVIAVNKLNNPQLHAQLNQSLLSFDFNSQNKNNGLTVLKTTTSHPIFWITLFATLILSAFSLYQQGLQSPFIFDDIPNLSPMGQRQYLGFWHDVGLFLLQGDSGPTGRPLSLISFYINDTAWNGASAASFKYTNVMLHLLNGVLIFWLVLKLLNLTKLTSEQQCYAIALVTCGLWMLHPIQINTILYVVQRMAELSTLFMLTGLLCYLQGREALVNSQKTGWLWLLVGGGISLILALLSKETGILLVIYILVIEYFLIRPFNNQAPPHFNKVLSFAVWLPTFLLLLYLLKTALNADNFLARPFDATQRLMTEARVLWDYLNSIFLPSLSKTTLFHDDFVISVSLFEPITTLPAIVGILGLILLAAWLRYKQPIFSFAVFWFLGGHLLEATTVPLELYFEHRNYLPLFGIIFAIAWYSLTYVSQWSWVPKLFFTGFVITTLTVTQHDVVQWTKPVDMVAGWLQDHPQSQRTLETLDAIIGEHINDSTRQQLLSELNAVSQQTNSSSYLIFRDLLLQCKKSSLTSNQLTDAVQGLKTSNFVNAAPSVFADLVSEWQQDSCGTVTADAMLSFIDTLKALPRLKNLDMQHSLHYWQAAIQARQGNLDETINSLNRAYQLRPELDTLFLAASYLNSAGLYEEALNKLQTAETDLCQSWRSCLNVKLRRADIEGFREILKKQLQQKQEISAYDHSIHYSAR